MTRQIVVKDAVYEALVRAQHFSQIARGPDAKHVSLSDIIEKLLRRDYVLHKAEAAIRDAQALLRAINVAPDAAEMAHLNEATIAIEKRLDEGA